MHSNYVQNAIVKEAQMIIINYKVYCATKMFLIKGTTRVCVRNKQ